jgi:ABC-2 type transport system ATP-binding protein
MGSPRIVFLDEPTTGLDPRGRQTMWQAIRSLASDGVTIFLTTQYLEEADRLADHIALLDGGKLVAEGTAEELKRLTPGGHIRLKFADPTDLESAAAVLDTISRDDSQLALQVASDGGIKSIRSVLDQLESRSIEADSLTVHTPDLDDVFFALTGQTTTNEEVSS